MTDLITSDTLLALTSIDIATLRKADRVAFHHYDDESCIVAIKANHPSNSNPFARDVDHRIKTTSTFRDYSEGTDVLASARA